MIYCTMPLWLHKQHNRLLTPESGVNICAKAGIMLTHIFLSNNRNIDISIPLLLIHKKLYAQVPTNVFFFFQMLMYAQPHQYII